MTSRTELRSTILFLAAVIGAVPASLAEVKPSPNGIAFPKGYQNWRVISMSHRTDNNTVRIIVGNKTAVDAARAGKTNPWPDGTVLGKVVWKQAEATHWKKAVVPGRFVHAEFMFKDSKKYAATYGWGWARWKGMEQKPYGRDASVAGECIACHTPVKGNDWVFTKPAVLPKP